MRTPSSLSERVHGCGVIASDRSRLPKLSFPAHRHPPVRQLQPKIRWACSPFLFFPPSPFLFFGPTCPADKVRCDSRPTPTVNHIKLRSIWLHRFPIPSSEDRGCGPCGHPGYTDVATNAGTEAKAGSSFGVRVQLSCSD